MKEKDQLENKVKDQKKSIEELERENKQFQNEKKQLEKKNSLLEKDIENHLGKKLDVANKEL